MNPLAQIKKKIGMKRLILGIAVLWFLMVPFLASLCWFGFIFLLAPAVDNKLKTGDLMAPVDIDPANGIPADFVQYVREASVTYGVPMQLIAGVAITESGWNPLADASINFSNSHAAGLMQFQPETWSGWRNPFSRRDRPDTNFDTIRQYGGYGKNGTKKYAPIGTPPKVNDLEELHQTCLRSGLKGCAPYSSPFQPEDALHAGASYLVANYRVRNTWAGSLEQYYGGPGKEAYSQKVLRAVYAYIADNSPVRRPDGSYWLFGDAPLKLTRSGSEIKMKAVEKAGVDEPAIQFLTSVPLVAPVAGEVFWKQSGDEVVIEIPLPRARTVTVRVPARSAVKWMIEEEQESYRAKSGDVIGFLDLTTEVRVGAEILKSYPEIGSSTKIRGAELGELVLREG